MALVVFPLLAEETVRDLKFGPFPLTIEWHLQNPAIHTSNHNILTILTSLTLVASRVAHLLQRLLLRHKKQ